jgi:Flp pilus assembly protein TadG
VTRTFPTAKAVHRRLRRSFFADERGATAVEFGLIAPAFIALLVGIIQTFLAFFASQLLEQIVISSSRVILTNQAQSQNMTQSQFTQLVCSKVVILLNCSGLMIDVQAYSGFGGVNTSAPTLTYNAGKVSNAWQYNPGQPGQIVVVRLMYEWPVFGGPLGFTLSNLADGNRLIMASSAFQNEP